MRYLQVLRWAFRNWAAPANEVEIKEGPAEFKEVAEQLEPIFGEPTSYT